ncbi:prepilin peptidase [Agrococcus sp. UYP10]|uniref:prepilin peptidase n=1 Tax=Agrococcus sp. UYP10 TaxID=1756355 RepID=UPI0033985500
MTTTSAEAVRLRARAVDLLGAPAAVSAASLLALGGWDAVVSVPLAVAAALAPALARIDVAERRLPNALTVPLLLLGAAAGAVRLVQGDLAPLAALACGLVLLAMALAGGMGMGDVKLGLALALATATLGWAAPLTGLAASVMVGGVLGAAALVAGRRTVPFGPALLLGNAIAAAAGASGVL